MPSSPPDRQAARIAELEAEIATLRRSDALHRAVLDSARDFAIFTTDLHGAITSWNPGAEKLLGWPEAEAVGHHACMIFTPADRAHEACEREMLTACETGRAEDERWHLRRDGSTFWSSGLMMRLEDEATGEHIGYLKVLRDRTRQHEAHERVRASEARMQLVLDNAVDALYGVDRDGVTTLCNRAFLQMLGFEREEDALGRRLHDIIHHSHPDGSRYDEGDCPLYNAARNSEQAHVTGERFFRLDGTAFPVEYWVQPIFKDGEPQGAICTFVDLTERERVESERSRLAAIVEQSRDFIGVADTEGRVFFVNEAGRALLGLGDLESIRGTQVTDYFVPEDQATVAETVLPAVARDGYWEGELRFRNFTTGAVVPVLYNIFPVRDAAGQIVGYGTVTRDLTHKKSREAALRREQDRTRATEARYRDLFEAIDVGFCVVEMKFDEQRRPIDYRLVEVNPAFERQTGLVGAAGKWVSEVAPGLERHWFETYGRVALTGESVRFENVAEPFGRYYDVHAFRTGDPDGHRVAILFNDITDRRRAELRLRELNESLERRVEAAIADRDRTWNNARDLLLVVGNDGVFRAVNPAWTHILGWTPEELVGRSYLDLIHPDDHPSSQDALATAVARELPVYENRYRHKDGSYRWISWVAAPEGDLIYASGRDVTGEKERQGELEVAQEQLRQAQKMEAVGQLTGGIAHDFNNLLTGVIGSLDMMQRQIARGDTTRTERYATAAVTSANRAAALTHRLLAFSRRQPLDPKPVNTNRLVTGMEELLRRTLGESIRLEIVTAGGLWQTLCDPHQLESAILNLAINARDAMPDGGTLTIETCNAHLDNAYAAREREVRPGQYICICVTDTGTGMTRETIEKAFEPFFTTKPIGQGTGLGLSMIYGFARQSEGYAKIYSETGQGTTFKLYLPRHHGEGEEIEDATVELGEEHRAEAGEVVLVVEDETAVRNLVVDVLEELGYRAVEAVDGPSGLRLLHSDMRVDLLVTDIGLPGLNGRQLAEAAREKRPDLQVLFMTGYAENATIANGFLEPGMEMITKPFAIDALATRIREMIEATGP